MAVRHAGPTVAAAGLILAGTFASLMLAGNSLLTQMGFAISFGIAIVAFVMATVPHPGPDRADRPRRLVARPRRRGPRVHTGARTGLRRLIESRDSGRPATGGRCCVTGQSGRDSPVSGEAGVTRATPVRWAYVDVGEFHHYCRPVAALAVSLLHGRHEGC